MKIDSNSLKLVDLLNIEKYEDYKIHLARKSREGVQPLDLFYNDYKRWLGWNRHRNERDDFNCRYILTLIEDYNSKHRYLFGGIFEVIKDYGPGKYYEIEEVEDYEEYKGKLWISFVEDKYQGRAFKLTTYHNDLIVKEIIDKKEKLYEVISTKTPNLFNFATSELSQDAMFAWLLQWSDDAYLSSDNELCQLGKQFMSLLTQMSAEEIHKVKVGRQMKNIDVWAEVNDDTFLVIEDKTGTSTHDNQLSRYKDFVEHKFNGKRENLRFAYVKTENEPGKREQYIREKENYETINRQQLLEVLNCYTGEHPIVRDYRAYLQTIEDKTNAYKTLPISQWKGGYIWQGFFKQLENVIDFVDEWGYVANPTGGFMGLWTNWKSDKYVDMYLQFESSKLCVKIHCEEKENMSKFRNIYHSNLMKKSKEAGIRICKPERFGSGKYMTIGVVDSEEVFPGGICDFNNLSAKLKTLNGLITEILQESI